MTSKQKMLAKKILEDRGLPMNKAMKEVGYSDAYAKNPQQLTETATWQELMKEYLPDASLAKAHQEGLEATRTSNAAILVTQDGKIVKAEEQGLIEVPDYATRHKYLETAYKLKGKLGSESLAAEMKDGNKTIRIIITRGEK